MKPAAKTNAARILDQLGIHYDMASYDVDPDDLSAEAVAAKIGLPDGQVFKTLVLAGQDGQIVMACVPAGTEIDLKALARACGQKKVEMVPLKDVRPLTGYIRGGVSPLGTKRRYPVYVDESALNHLRISVSAGIRGCQILIAPGDLQTALQAHFAPISTPHGQA